MRGFVCTAKVRTNEDYKKLVKKRMKLFAVTGVVGGITMVMGYLAEWVWKVSINEKMLGIYTGFGAGLLAISVAIWVLNKRLLSNEEKLKESRISRTDERVQEIMNRALGIATMVMLIAVYVMILLGGLFYPVIVIPLFCLITLFIVSYFVAYLYLSKKM